MVVGEYEVQLVWGCENEMLVLWGQFEVQFEWVWNELKVVGGAYIVAAGWSMVGLVTPLGVLGRVLHGHGLQVRDGRHRDPPLDHQWRWVGVVHFVGW